MKDWATLDADEVLLMRKHYTKGRQGKTINKVIIHHNGGNLTIRGCYDVWQTREASAHYQVDATGRIGQLVYDRDTAWHAGDWPANLTSIGIEHADIKIGNDNDPSGWRISEQTVDNGSHLVAAICHHYGLGRPTWGRNLFGHSDFGSTGCPMVLAKGNAQHDDYVWRAQRWYDEMTLNKNVTTIIKNTVGGIMAISDADARRIATALLDTKLGKSGPLVKVALQDGYWTTKTIETLVKNLPHDVWAAKFGQETAGERLGLAANGGRK